MLDHGACASNLSEVSEDLSIWGNQSPPTSARSGSAPIAGQSLEISASVDTEASNRCIPGKLGDDGGASFTALGALEASKLPAGSATKSWTSLQAELKVLAEALKGIKMIRTKQQEFLQQLRGM